MNSCICENRNKKEFRLKYWEIRQYKCNHSAFNGYRYTPSDYSEIHCLECNHFWRTKADYVEELQ